MTFQTTFKRWQDDYADFKQLAESIPKDLQLKEGLCGVWSSKQVIAHLAGWQREAYNCYQKYMDGYRGPIDYEIDAYNASSVAALSLLNWKETLDTLDHTTEDLSSAATAITGEHLASNPLYEVWLKIMIEEFEVHGEQIRTWLGEQ